MSPATARFPLAACAGLLAVLATAACARTSSGPSRPSQGKPADHTITQTRTPCDLPSVPPTDGSLRLSGPALTALTGGPAEHSFSLDGGALTVDPPQAGDSPAVPQGQAKCVGLASSDPSGEAVGSYLGGGLAIGYGRVTVRSNLLGHPTSQVQYTDGTVGPVLPAIPAYRSRLAWVLVVRAEFSAPCPMRVGPPPTPAVRPDDHDYLIFLLDAATGAAALNYTEGRVGLCDVSRRDKPYVGVPIDSVSVPWTLASRDPGGYSGRISTQMTRCDGYDPLVLADAYRIDYVQVIVQRPIGVTCPAVRHTLSLHAATVTSDLPRKLVHAPTGLAFPWAYVPPSTAPPIDGELLEIGADRCGGSITVDVGTVLVLPSVSDAVAATYPVRLSAPSVVGFLDGPETGSIAELRAWSAGKADITVTGRVDGAPRTCAKPWRLHVTVR